MEKYTKYRNIFRVYNVCVFIYVCVCVCVYVGVYVFIHSAVGIHSIEYRLNFTLDTEKYNTIL